LQHCSTVTVVARVAGSYSLLFRTSFELPGIGSYTVASHGPCTGLAELLVAGRNEALCRSRITHEQIRQTGDAPRQDCSAGRIERPAPVEGEPEADDQRYRAPCERLDEDGVAGNQSFRPGPGRDSREDHADRGQARVYARSAGACARPAALLSHRADLEPAEPAVDRK